MILETIAVAFGMFSAIPVPQPVWTEKNMRYVLCAFPLIGFFCGLAWAAWAFLAEIADAPFLLRTAGFSLLPVWITGGIHLDGYADTSDARASYGDIQKKQAILHDPHCGAFAVIRLCSYFVLWFSLCGVFVPTKAALLCMGMGFVLSRALSGAAITCFPIAKETGLAHTFASTADRNRVRQVLLGVSALLMLGMVCIGGFGGVAMSLTALLLLGYYRRVAEKEFGGISGDLAGWFLQKTELWMLAAWVAVSLWEALV